MFLNRFVLIAALALAGCGVQPPACDATSCASGCCDADGVCQFPTALTCGLNGYACQACVGAQFCSFGICVTPSSGNGGGTGNGGGAGGGGGAIGGGGGGATGGGGGGTATGGGGGGTGGGGTATGGGGGAATGGGGGTGSCTPGVTCATNPSRPCILGVVACVGGAATCVDSTNFAMAGTPCGTNQVCNSTGTCGCSSGSLSCQGQCTQCSTPPNAVPSCNGTSCDFTCVSGFHRCGTSCLSDTSVNSCGTRCTPCSSTGGTPICSGGQCGLSSCNSGFLLCGGACAPCTTPANAMPTCNGTTCSFECNPGRLLCQGQCAACSTPANASPSCNGTACDFTCNTGYERVGQSCLRIATWQLSSATGPSARYGAAMAYDRARSRMVLFGGHSVVNNLFVHRSDTWEFNGTSWSNPSSSGPSIPSSSTVVTSIIYAMAYDVGRGRAVLFDGANGSAGTYEWTGSLWSGASFTATPSFVTARLAYDPVGGRVILVTRGASSLETWGWTGTSWTLLSNGGPPVNGFALATDTTRSRVMLFGGATASSFSTETNDLWEWDGSFWTQRTVTGTLPPRQRTGVMTFDASRNKLVLLGGRASGGNDGLTWEFDGTRWTSFPAPFVYGDVPSLAYDENRQATVLFGGNRSSTSTYELKR